MLPLRPASLIVLGTVAFALQCAPKEDASNVTVAPDIGVSAEIEANPSSTDLPRSPTGAWQDEVVNPVWSLFIAEADIRALNEELFADVEVPATLVADGAVYDLKVELQGGSSRTYPKKNFRLKFSGSDPFNGNPFENNSAQDGFKRLVLRASWKDQSFVREAIAFKALERIGGNAPRVSWVNLQLNGTYWGLYTVVEPIDEDFLARRQFRTGGELYKAVRQAAGFKPGIDVHEGYEKKSGKEDEGKDFKALNELLELIWNTPITEHDYLNVIDPLFPIERILQRLMWASYTQNGDSIRHNYYLYREPTLWPEDEALDGQWWILPWDSDICLSNHWKLEEAMEPVESHTMLSGPAFLSENLAKIDSFRTTFVDLFESYLATEWSPDAMSTLIEELYEAHAFDIELDLHHWERTSSVDEEFDELRLFVAKRPAVLIPLLAKFRESPHIDEIHP